MSADATRKLHAELKARDAFLAKATSTLAGSAKTLERAMRTKRMPASVREANEELQSLLRELRIIAEPDSPVPMKRSKLELCDTLAAYFAQRRSACRRRGLRLTVRRSGAVYCRADVTHILTMLEELLSNALKYQRGRPVTVHITTAHGFVMICVTNHGAWVGRKARFARFQRGEARRKLPGFGVGLWLTRRLAVAHGGRLTIRGDATRTRVCVSLPLSARGREPVELCATLAPT